MSIPSLVDDLDRLANRPRTVLQREYWFPLAVFGTLAVVAAAVFDRWDPSSTASWAYWAVLGPLGGLLTGAWFARRSDSLGIHDGHPAVYLAGYGACVVGCSLAGALVSEPWTYPVVFSIVGALNVLLGLVDRYPFIALVGGSMILVSIVGGVAGLGPVAFSLVLAVLLLAAAAVARLTR